MERSKYKYILQTPEGASLCLDGNATIVDIDIPDGIKKITFTGEKTGVRIFSWSDVDLTGIKKQFADVEEIIIEKGIRFISIRNEMFPNVRTITSKSNYYKSGTMLVSRGEKLCNAFCLRQDEKIDLNGIEIIEDFAFSGCLSTNIINDEKIKTLYDDTFSGSMLLYQPYKQNLLITQTGHILVNVNPEAEEITIDGSIKIISPSADFSNVKKLHLKKLKDIVKLSFTQIQNISDLYIDGNTKIDISEFDLIRRGNRCENLERLHIGKDNSWFKTIDGMVYSENAKTLVFCPAGKTGTVQIPDGVECIYDYAFANTNLSKIIIPDSMREIGTLAFYLCKKLESIDFGNGIDRLGTINNTKLISYCPNLKKLEVPPQVKYISANSFSGESIEELILHEGLIYIDKCAFAENGIKEVVLPSSLKGMGRNCLLGVEKIVVLSDENPKGMVSGVVRDSKQVTYEKSKELYSKIITVEQKNGDTVYFPAYMTSDTIVKFSYEYSVHGFKKEYVKQLYSYGITSEAKQDIALEIYTYTNEPEIAAYLRRVGGTFAKRLLKEDDQETLVQFLKMGLMTQNAMKKILKEAETQNATMVSAYILKALNEKSENTSFRL